MLSIPKIILDDIFGHSIEDYPEECCGILVGHDEGENRIITASHRAKNVSKERRHERYIIDEERLIEITRMTRSSSVDIVGFYHSHPDYPSRPSDFDRENAAWPGYSYLIVSVSKNAMISFQSWIMPDEGNSFVEEPIRTEGTPSS